MLKASKLSPQKGMARAAVDVIDQRKVMKANASSLGSQPGNVDNPRSSPTPALLKSTRQNAWPTPNTSYPISDFQNVQLVLPPRLQLPTKPTKEEVSLEMRAKLFLKDNSSGWVKTATGTLCHSNWRSSALY